MTDVATLGMIVCILVMGLLSISVIEFIILVCMISNKKDKDDKEVEQLDNDLQ